MTGVPEYVEARATRIMRDLPRFGHTKTFSFVTGSKEQRQDYLYGLLFAGVFIIAFFLAWTILLAVFKCLGQKKVGFLSGKPFKVPYGSKKPKRVRTAFFVAAVVLVIFAFLLVFKGLTQVKTGVSNVYRSSVAWNKLLAEAEALVNRLVRVAKTRAIPLQKDLYTRLSEELCDGVDLEEETGISFGAIAQNVSLSLDALDDFQQTKLEDVSESLAELEDISENAAETTEAITPDSWQSLIFIIPFPIFCSLLCTGVLLAWNDRSYKCYTRFLRWGVLPLFFILIVICYILSGAIAIAASANADFCSGGTENTPQRSILEIMLLNGYSKEDTTLQIVDHYVTTCKETEGGPFSFLYDFEDNLTAAESSVSTMNQAMANVTADAFESFCGDESYAALRVLTANMETTLFELKNITAGALELVACETILPIFTNALWDGTCQYSVKGVTWTFASFLVIGMMGMLMITFRSSFFLTEDVDDDKLHTVPMEYDGGGQGVEYEPYQPSKSLSMQDNVEESYGLEQPQENADGSVEVVTGVAAGAAVGAAATGAAIAATKSVGSDNNIKTKNTDNSPRGDESDGSKTKDTENSPSAFDDSSWLDNTTAPAGDQY